MSSPETAVPSPEPTFVPEALPPEPTGPELAASEAIGSEDAAPEAAGPEGAAPEAAGPEGAAPEVAASEAAAPEVAAPEAAAPEPGSELAASEPAAPEPAVVDPAEAKREQAWAAIEATKQEDGYVRGRVTEVVKGGLILDIGVRGFLPASLVEMRRVRDLAPYIGRELDAKIIELDKTRNNVVLSRRAWLEQHQSTNRGDLLDKIQKGQVRKGVISSVVAFGAFVDLGGVDGLVHVSELSWKHIDHPSEVVQVGQEVDVEVLDIDQARKRVSLSLKATREDPWRQFARTHAIGQIVPGTVTKLVPFGVFVRLDDGIEGLIHISELAEGHIELPEEIVRAGDGIFVKIIDIDLERHRISLSLRQANEGFLEGEEHFDPTVYGMAATYDNDGNYIYPEGFDSETGEWLEGFEQQRDAWEQQYSDARERWEAHSRQVLANRGAGQ
jgi:small subunit ribosomal protein S1